jgi:flavin reductase (DIM6/NTAB) family NADH-FMN oxidoreductase RutF
MNNSKSFIIQELSFIGIHFSKADAFCELRFDNVNFNKLMAISNDEFRAALSRFPSGVTVVTTKDAGDVLHGITVSAFCSLSLDPPMVLICIEKAAGSHDALAESKAFVVNILSSTQASLSEQFASLLPDKFLGVSHRPGLNGMPVLESVVASLECSLKQVSDGGDHSIFVGDVENVSFTDGDPILYFRGDYRAIS